jgi:diphthine-ammonia ligase
MAESLNVIALISGGKDSFYSLIHCVENGHRVVALGNLYPPPPATQDAPHHNGQGEAGGIHNEEKVVQGSSSTLEVVEEADLNSFMYQTVGHTVIPLYAEALGIPLYRQEIVGSAVQTGTSYQRPNEPSGSAPEAEEDETESLVPLLRRIMAAHPEANALSTGAILSTYQRTRIESVALRLGLVPLGFLWKYPVLPPSTQIALLQDMAAVGLDARIIKVASGGLDEEFLWENVASVRGMTRVQKAMKRFGNETDGSVIGEGGEFETLVVDGPSWLFKGRIEVAEAERRVIREGGGAAWLAIENAKVVMKDGASEEGGAVRVPELLDAPFKVTLEELENTCLDGVEVLSVAGTGEDSSTAASTIDLKALKLDAQQARSQEDATLWTIAVEPDVQFSSFEDKIEHHIQVIRQKLLKAGLQASDILFAVIILRSMDDFAVVNKVITLKRTSWEAG